MAVKTTSGLQDTGLLITRIGLGAMFVLHGWPKLAGGKEAWEKTGSALTSIAEKFDVAIGPAWAWGLTAGIAEFGGGILLVLGLLSRVAALFLLGVMVVAATMHVRNDDGFQAWSRPVELAAVFLGLVLIGPGKAAIDHALFGKRPAAEEDEGGEPSLAGGTDRDEEPTEV